MSNLSHLLTTRKTYLREDWKELFELKFLLSAFGGTAHLFNQLQGWIEIQGTQGITDVEGIDVFLAITIVD